jgi:hypothetical protein
METGSSFARWLFYIALLFYCDTAHQGLEGICLDRETLHDKELVGHRYAEDETFIKSSALPSPKMCTGSLTFSRRWRHGIRKGARHRTRYVPRSEVPESTLKPIERRR